MEKSFRKFADISLEELGQKLQRKDLWKYQQEFLKESKTSGGTTGGMSRKIFRNKYERIHIAILGRIHQQKFLEEFQ